MKLYAIDVRLAATAYIKANSPEQARQIAEQMELNTIEVANDGLCDVPIYAGNFDADELPDKSLSPAMTIWGPYPDAQITEVDGMRLYPDELQEEA